MPLLTVVIVLIAVGILMGLVNKYGPPTIDPSFVRLINIVVFVAVVIWLLNIFGVWAYLSKVTV